MRVSRILLLCLFALFPPWAARAQQAATPQIMQDVKSGDWNDALALAQATGDPLMVKLVTFFQLLCPGGGTADEIQSFIDTSPDWPEQGLLTLRQQQAAGTYVQNFGAPDVPFLDQVQSLHESGNDTGAASLWASQGNAAEAAATPDAQLLFWPAQDQLARALLSEGDAKDAYLVVTAANPPSRRHDGAGADCRPRFPGRVSAPAVSERSGRRQNLVYPACRRFDGRYHPGAGLLLDCPLRDR